jgi:site-specific recombinase XerD
MKYASHQDPTAMAVIQRVLAIPLKRFDRPLVGFLSREQIDAVLAAPDRSTWSGQRDHVLFATMYNTGARVSEVTAMRRMDLALERSAVVMLHGKGRKGRSVPLWQTTADALRCWLIRLPNQPDQPVFPNARGKRMSRSGVEDRLDAAVRAAAKQCPSLRERNVSPHMLRHSTAMHLLQSGVDITVIALWLGHESPATTHLYLEADLQMKERALATVPAADVKARRYRPDNRLLAFLQAL